MLFNKPLKTILSTFYDYKLFHQFPFAKKKAAHKTFLTKFWRKKITKANITREIRFHTKNALIKCFWNWHLNYSTVFTWKNEPYPPRKDCSHRPFTSGPIFSLSFKEDDDTTHIFPFCRCWASKTWSHNPTPSVEVKE